MPEVSSIELNQLTPINNSKNKMQTNSAVRLQNNYSDINLSNGGGSIPEEYKPSGRSSDIKTVVQSNYSNVNQSQILQKTNDISTVQEKLETSS